MEKKEFVKLMGAVESVFETKAKDEAGYMIWFNALKDIDYTLASKAVSNLTATNHGFLAPAQIRQACLEITNPKPSFIEAYQLMNDTISKFGRYRQQEAMDNLKKENDAMYKVVKAIGFNTVCSSGASFTRGPIERMYKEVTTSENGQLLIGNYSDDISEMRSKALPRFRDGDEY